MFLFLLFFLFKRKNVFAVPQIGKDEIYLTVVAYLI